MEVTLHLNVIKIEHVDLICTWSTTRFRTYRVTNCTRLRPRLRRHANNMESNTNHARCAALLLTATSNPAKVDPVAVECDNAHDARCAKQTLALLDVALSACDGRNGQRTARGNGNNVEVV